MNADVKPAAAGIDWQAVRKRLDRADAAVEEAFNPSPAHAKAIMDARARRLAPMAEASRPPGANVGVVLFGLGRERYAIETRFVRRSSGSPTSRRFPEPPNSSSASPTCAAR